MESGAKGCEVVVSGKLRGQRAKSMKFVDGLMIHSGDPINEYVDTAVRHVLLRQGIVVTYGRNVELFVVNPSPWACKSKFNLSCEKSNFPEFPNNLLKLFIVSYYEPYNGFISQYDCDICLCVKKNVFQLNFCHV